MIIDLEPWLLKAERRGMYSAFESPETCFRCSIRVAGACIVVVDFCPADSSTSYSVRYSVAAAALNFRYRIYKNITLQDTDHQLTTRCGIRKR